MEILLLNDDDALSGAATTNFRPISVLRTQIDAAAFLSGVGYDESARVPACDDLVRAAVYAFPADGTLAERSAAALNVITVHRRWPLIAYEYAIERAEVVFAVRCEEELTDELAWYALALRDPSLLEPVR